MPWLKRICLALLMLPTAGPCEAAANPVAGFDRSQTATGTEVAIWYPATGTPVAQRIGLHMQTVATAAPVASGRYPLVVISHGSGGSNADHYDTALALARAGFVVAALTHPGDNWRDRSRATDLDARARALSDVVTHILANWQYRDTVDPTRIGAFGFSAGGFTVLAAAGGKADLTRIDAHCARNPANYDCRLLAGQAATAARVQPRWSKDTRIKAVVVAAPALGFTFGRTGLADVTVPVQLWRADDDDILPAPHYADAVRAALPGHPDFRPVPGARHFDFIAPCDAKDGDLARLCASADGFDRTAFHATFNAEIIRFFGNALRP
jgi:predicted dienelactone hydrolase